MPIAPIPICPHCSTPMFDQGDIATFHFQAVTHNKALLGMVWCGKCGKVISMSWSKPFDIIKPSL